MGKRYGKCTNLTNCTKADSKEIIEILHGIDFECPECGSSLIEVQNNSTGGLNKNYLKIGGIIAAIALIGALIMKFIGPGSDICNSLPYISASDTTIVCNSVPYNMRAGDTLVIEGEVLKVKRVKSGPVNPTPPVNPSASDEYEIIRGKGFVNLGAQASAPPLNYQQDGQRLGLDFEIIKLIFNQSEFGFTSNSAIRGDFWVDEYDDIPSLLSKKSNGNSFDVDIISGGLAYVDGDLDGVIFTDSYLEDFGYCLISKKSETFRDLRGLRGQKIGVVAGDPDVKAYIEGKVSGIEVVEFQDADDDWINKCFNDPAVKAVVYDYPFAVSELANMRKMGIRHNLQIKVSYLPDSDLSYKIGLRAGNETLRQKLNAAISKIKSLPSYSGLIRKYLKSGDVVRPSNSGGLPTHTVIRGETLGGIARDRLRDVNRWYDIQELNNLGNPHLIEVGQVLIMPEDFR